MRLPFNGTFIQTQNWNDPRYRSNYSKFDLLGHNGEDYGCPAWTPILAPHKGIIKEAIFDSGYGNYVKVESDEEGSILAHLSKISVALNQEVEEGQVVGYSGNTGNSTAAHLHWGYYRTRTRNRDNGLNGYIDQTDWLDHKCSQEIAYASTASDTPNYRFDAIRRGYKALTGQWVKDEEVNPWVQKGISLDDAMTEIMKGDGRFFKLWIEPRIKELIQFQEVVAKAPIAKAGETVEVITKTYSVQPKTAPKTPEPIFSGPLVNFLLRLLNKFGIKS